MADETSIDGHPQTEEILRLYRSGQAIYQICRQLRVAHRTVRSTLKKVNEPLNHKKRPPKPTHGLADEMVRLFRDEGLTVNKIAERLDCHWRAVSRHLDEAGIVRHANGSRIEPSSKRRYTVKEQADAAADMIHHDPSGIVFLDGPELVQLYEELKGNPEPRARAAARKVLREIEVRASRIGSVSDPTAKAGGLRPVPPSL